MNFPTSLPPIGLGGGVAGLPADRPAIAPADSTADAAAWFLDPGAAGAGGIRLPAAGSVAGAADVSALAQRVLAHLIEAG